MNSHGVKVPSSGLIAMQIFVFADDEIIGKIKRKGRIVSDSVRKSVYLGDLREIGFE